MFKNISVMKILSETDILNLKYVCKKAVFMTSENEDCRHASLRCNVNYIDVSVFFKNFHT